MSGGHWQYKDMMLEDHIGIFDQEKIRLIIEYVKTMLHEADWILSGDSIYDEATKELFFKLTVKLGNELFPETQ